MPSSPPANRRTPTAAMKTSMRAASQKQDRRKRESCPRVVDDRGEVRRERVGPPVPNGDDHQDTEQDRPRGPQRRDVMRGKLVRKADLGAQIAHESNEKDFPDQVDGARPGPRDSFASRTRDAHCGVAAHTLNVKNTTPSGTSRTPIAQKYARKPASHEHLTRCSSNAQDSERLEVRSCSRAWSAFGEQTHSNAIARPYGRACSSRTTCASGPAASPGRSTAR